jgi:hypothetical protein
MKRLKDSQRKAIFAKAKYGYGVKPRRASPLQQVVRPSLDARYSSSSLVNDARVRRGLKGSVFTLLRQDPEFSKVRYKFDTLMFNYKGEDYSVNFSTNQSHDAVTGVWKFKDFRKTPKGWAYSKEMVSDMFGFGGGKDNQTPKEMINDFKSLVDGLYYAKNKK